MADYSAQNLGLGTPALQGVSPVRKDNSVKQMQQTAFTDLVSRFAQAGMKGYAAGQGENAYGLDQSNVDVSETVSLFEDEVAIQKSAMERQVGGPLSEAQIADIKQEALSNLATTTREVKALLANDQIRSTEANAQVRKLLSGYLSNPMLAMYQDEFLNVASGLTGDVGVSPTEKREATIAAAREKAFVEQQELVATLTVGGNMSEEDATKVASMYMMNKTETEALTSGIENDSIKDKVSVKQAFNKSAEVIRTSLGMMASKPEFYDQVSGKLLPEGMNAMKRELQNWQIEQISLINNSNLDGEARKVAIETVNQEVKLYSDLTDLNSFQAEVDAARELNMSITEYIMTKERPLATYFIKNNMGDLALNLMLGQEQGKKFIESLGYDVDGVRARWQAGGKWYNPNLSMKSYFSEGTGINPNVEPNAQETAALSLYRKEGYEGVEKQFGKDVADEVERTMAAKFAIPAVSSPENYERIRSGDKKSIDFTQEALSRARLNLLAYAGTPENLGQIVKGDSQDSRRYKTQPDNSPFKVDWTMGKDSMMGAKAKEMDELYTMFYVLSQNNGPIEDPMEAFNNWLSTGEVDLNVREVNADG